MKQLTPSSSPNQQDETQGRHSKHSEEDYKQYWTLDDSQKQEFVRQSYELRNAADPYATSRDYNARELEIKSIKASLRHKGAILDLGCGNGYTLLSLARDLADWQMVGIDFSENLIHGANQLAQTFGQDLKSRPRFVCADALAYLRDTENESIDYVVTERFIQNLPSHERQREVIGDIFRLLRPKGRLLMCEGGEEGFNALNILREGVGLSTIPATSADNISSIRLKDADIEGFTTNEVGFNLVGKLGYSAYFVMSRVLHPLLVAPERPRFDAKINDSAARIQEQMPFQPGYGSNTLWVLEKP
jgi:ubiquinone/menaquinone biosynthesis C-methylase UbiE